MTRPTAFLAALLTLALSASAGNIFDDPPARAEPPTPPSPPSSPPLPTIPQPISKDLPAPAAPAPVARAPETAPAKSPPPSASDLRDAMKLVDEVYRADLAAAKTPELKKALSRKLLDDAANEKQAGRYALLTRARDLAIESGDVVACEAALDALAASFTLDALKMRADAGLALVPTVRLPAERSKLVEGLSALVQSALAADRFDVARTAADTALTTARAAGDAELTRLAAAAMQAFREAETAFAEIKKPLATLADKPADPDANLKVGKYRCFFKGDWKAGLPMLALSGDPALKALAEKELAPAPAAEDQLAIADGWWDVADKLTGPAKQSVKSHAAAAYETALPALSGLAKVKAAKRIDEAKTAAAGPAAEKRVDAFTVEAFIDGDSELHLTPTGLYWVETDAAKPGRHDGANEATYISGKAWMPKWGIPREERGSDRTELLPLPLGNADFAVEVLAISTRKGAAGIAKRDPVTIKKVGDEWIVYIPDRQSGAMWYSLKLTRTTAKP